MEECKPPDELYDLYERGRDKPMITIDNDQNVNNNIVSSVDANISFVLSCCYHS